MDIFKWTHSVVWDMHITHEVNYIPIFKFCVKTVLKPIWTYGIELWGCASTSNVAVIQRYQSKLLRTITNAPWYVSNHTLHHRPTSSQGLSGTDCYPSLNSGLTSQPPCGTTSTPVKQQATKTTMDIWWATLRLRRWTPPRPPSTNDRTLAHRKWCIHVFWLLIMVKKKNLVVCKVTTGLWWVKTASQPRKDNILVVLPGCTCCRF